jgi:putative aldouronate transport system permease protein
LIAASITDETTLTQFGYAFIPKKVSFAAYQYLASSWQKIVKAYGMTIFVTAIGTFCNIFLTMFMGYLLSKKDLPGRTFLSFFVFFTMLFSGGMVPSYIIWTQVFHVRDTIWSLIFPNLLLGAYNIILMRTYFSTNVPQEIIEAAEMDNCSEIGILFRIAIPLSKPMIATVALFAGLAYWNDWINGIYYLVRRTDYYTIQNVLNTMMSNAEFLANQTNMSSTHSLDAVIPTSGVRMGIAVIAVIPILIIYPFFQKFFVKGIVVGGVKG